VDAEIARLRDALKQLEKDEKEFQRLNPVRSTRISTQPAQAGRRSS